jgi:uridine phosphorylase
MPTRLRPTGPIAPAAILVGDPGRALALAQELLEQPKMCHHARGLWGYSGGGPSERELTVQSTGMGGPSATIVLTDLAEIGVRRAIRVGTCTALDADLAVGQLLAIEEAHAWGGGGAGEALRPDAELASALLHQLGEAGAPATVASLDALHSGGAPAPVAAGDAADMQTAALFGAGRDLGVAMAAVLVVTESASGEGLEGEHGEKAVRRAGKAAAASLTL